MTNYLAICKRRFPTHCVGGSGRYAVYAPVAGPLSKTLLFDSYSEAARQIVDPRYAKIIDLAAPVVDLEKMREVYDPEDRRRERRE